MKTFMVPIFVLTTVTAAVAFDDIHIGSQYVLGKGADGAACAASRDQLKAAYNAASNNDNDGVNEALEGGAVLKRGEKVLLIDSAMGSGFDEGIDLKLRIMTGPDAHLSCWSWEKTLHLQPT